MNKDFENFVSSSLIENIEPYKRVAEDGPGGPLGGKSVPVTPAQFHKQLTDREEYSVLDEFDIDKLIADQLIALADNKYISYYAGWVNSPLAADAPDRAPEQVAWQKAARAAAATDPLITTDFKTLEQRVAALEAKVK